jgi:putative chitinase
MNVNALSPVVGSAVAVEITPVMQKFGITTPLRLAHFLAQCSHESANFTALRENLNYSAQSLRKVFGKYFPTDALANAYARQPEKIANRVYGGRMGNGDEASGDGFNFRGRGYIQLTGKSNYKLFGDFIGDDLIANPDLVATKYPLTSAGFFFQKNVLWTICDRGANDDIVTSVTRRVNGGTHGLEDRIAKFKKYHQLLCS